MELNIRPMTTAETMYCYSQSHQIEAQTGCIGHLRGYFDGESLLATTWTDHNAWLKSEEFKTEFDSVINGLKADPQYEGLLRNRSTMGKYCYGHNGKDINEDLRNFGFRADSKQYSYMLRLNPYPGEYNVYCYCFRKEWLNSHLKEAERGIRFVDSNYKELFRVPDGGKVKITSGEGKAKEYICRYVDSYHVEMNRGSTDIYHICELAEKLEQSGSKAEPLTPLPEKCYIHRDIQREER